MVRLQCPGSHQTAIEAETAYRIIDRAGTPWDVCSEHAAEAVAAGQVLSLVPLEAILPPSTSVLPPWATPERSQS